MSLTKLVLPAQIKRNYDADAAAYIAAVEAADGQSLERGVKDAITEFVVGCKTRGIWNSIKSCCLLCGARTIAGATVPLKGNAPMLTSFVGDYNRETGLRRTSGSFDINRNNNADPQNNKHVAVYPSSIDYGFSTGDSRSILTGSTGLGDTLFSVNSLGITIRVNTNTPIISNQFVFSNNLIGVSILNSSQSQLLYNNNINVISISTMTPSNFNLNLFGGNGVSASSSRIAFYSIGESLDLKFLDSCLKNLLYKISQTFDSSYTMQDIDAYNYTELVRQSEKVKSMGFTYRQSIDEFVTGCKSDGIWNSLSSCAVLIGAQNLLSAMTPLKGVQLTKTNPMIDSDYIMSMGVKGSTFGTGSTGDTKFFNTSINNNTMIKDNFHMSLFIMSPDSRSSEVVFMGVGLNNSGSNQLNSYGVRNFNGIRSNFNGNIGNTFYGTSRNSLTGFNSRINKTNISGVGISADDPYNATISIFGAGVTGTTYAANCTDARLSFYSIGQNLDLSLLDNRVTKLVNNISSRRII